MNGTAQDILASMLLAKSLKPSQLLPFNQGEPLGAHVAAWPTTISTK